MSMSFSLNSLLTIPKQSISAIYYLFTVCSIGKQLSSTCYQCNYYWLRKDYLQGESGTYGCIVSFPLTIFIGCTPWKQDGSASQSAEWLNRILQKLGLYQQDFSRKSKGEFVSNIVYVLFCVCLSPLSLRIDFLVAYRCLFSKTHSSSYCYLDLYLLDVFSICCSPMSFQVRQGNICPQGQDMSLYYNQLTVQMAIQYCCFLRIKPFSFLQMASMAYSTLFSKQRLRALMANQISAISSNLKLMKFLLLVLRIYQLQVCILAYRRAIRFVLKFYFQLWPMRILGWLSIMKQKTLEFWQGSQCFQKSSLSLYVQYLQRSLRATQINFLCELLVERLYFYFLSLIWCIFCYEYLRWLVSIDIYYYLYTSLLININNIPKSFEKLKPKYNQPLMDTLPTCPIMQPHPYFTFLCSSFINANSIIFMEFHLINNQLNNIYSYPPSPTSHNRMHLFAVGLQLSQQANSAPNIFQMILGINALLNKERANSLILIGGANPWISESRFQAHNQFANKFNKNKLNVNKQVGVLILGLLSAQSDKSTTFLLSFLRIYNLLLQSKTFYCCLQFLLPFKNLGYQLVECSPSAFQSFSAGFNIDNPDLFSHFDCTTFIDFPIFLEVNLVADQEQVYFGDISFLIDFLDPEINHFERLDIGDIEDQQYAVNVPIVVRSNCIVACSSSCVPDLHPNRVPILQFQCLLLVLHPDRCCVVRAELLVHVLRQQGTLPHIALPYYQQFYSLFFPTHLLLLYKSILSGPKFKKYLRSNPLINYKHYLLASVFTSNSIRQANNSFNIFCLQLDAILW